MTKATSTGSGSGSSTAAEAQSSSASAAEGSSDGGAAADVAQATVLAQHELNKVGCCIRVCTCAVLLSKHTRQAGRHPKCWA